MIHSTHLSTRVLLACLINPLKFHEKKINCHCMYGLKSRLNNLRWHLMLQKQDTALTLFIILQIVQLQFQCSYHPSTPIRLNKHFFWFRFIYGHKLKRKEMKQKCHQSLWSYGSPLVVGPKIILQLIQICAKAIGETLILNHWLGVTLESYRRNSSLLPFSVIKSQLGLYRPYNNQMRPRDETST